MVIWYIALGILAAAILRITFKTRSNLKAIEEGKNLTKLALADLRAKGRIDLADMEASKLADKSYANAVYLTTGRGYSSGSTSSRDRYAGHMADSLIEHYKS